MAARDYRTLVRRPQTGAQYDAPPLHESSRGHPRSLPRLPKPFCAGGGPTDGVQGSGKGVQGCRFPAKTAGKVPSLVPFTPSRRILTIAC